MTQTPDSKDLAVGGSPAGSRKTNNRVAQARPSHRSRDPRALLTGAPIVLAVALVMWLPLRVVAAMRHRSGERPPRLADDMSRQVVVHVTECRSGGVPRAIELAIRATPGVRHIVLAHPGAVRTETFGAEFVPLPDGHLARVRALRRLVAETKPVFVQPHDRRAGLYARLGLPTTPVVYEPHAYSFEWLDKPAIMRGVFWLTERLLTWRTAAVLALTPHQERQARRLGVRRVHQIVNAPTVSRAEVEQRVEQSAEQGVEQSADDRPGVMTVAMVGRITTVKDPAFFARIAEAFADDPGVRFLWIGSNASEDFPAGQVALERAGVEITGWLAGSELTDTLAGVDLYVHTAVFEGFPLSLLDACELGVPSLVRDIPSLAGCGLPAFSTPEQAAAQIRELITDPAALAELTLRSRELSQRHGVDAHDASVRAAYAKHGVIAHAPRTSSASADHRSSIPAADEHLGSGYPGSGYPGSGYLGSGYLEPELEEVN